jgi:hypothetical protein
VSTSLENALAARIGSRRLAQLLRLKRQLERLPATWNCVIEKETLKLKELEHDKIEKERLCGACSKGEAIAYPSKSANEAPVQADAGK